MAVAKRKIAAPKPTARAAGKKGKKTPQPPGGVVPTQTPAPAGASFSYDPTFAQQGQQPYNDIMTGAALGSLPGMYQDVSAVSQNAQGSLGQYGSMLGLNMPTQQAAQQRLMGAYQGNKIFDPYISSQLDQQQQTLHDQLRRSLGPDYAASSAGSEALARFQQMRDHVEASAQQQAIDTAQAQFTQSTASSGQQGAQYGQMGYDMPMGIGNAMFSGQGQQQALAQGEMGLMAAPGEAQMSAGTGMANLSGGAVNAQQPYEQQTAGQAQMSTYPSRGQFAGMEMGQSANRWGSIGGNVGGSTFDMGATPAGTTAGRGG